MRVNLPVTTREYQLPAHEVIVSRTDLKGRITYVNETFVHACGFTRDELVGQAHNIVRHPDMPAAAFADLWRTIKAGRPWSGLVKNRCKDGGFYWVRANITPIVDGGKMVGYMSVRTAPSQAEKDAAGELYRKMTAGELRGLHLEGGELRHRGVLGLFERVARTSFYIRCWWTAGGLALLYAAMTILALTGKGDSDPMIATIGGVGVVAALGLGAWWSATVGRPIDHALATAIAVVGGDVGSSFPTSGETELKKLFRILDQMNAKLVGVLKDVNGSMHMVGTAASEIASGNTDLSQRTEEQAASLEETASSMEELTATVKQNADNAQQANQLAAAASSIASKGGAVVRTVVETMAGIERSSRQIAEINGTIDALAFQTNILALNAAVEAARAGEQGRGFAVVAGEVRALAQRSAAAAKEIKQLIEHSVEQVSTGTRLVDGAGQTMQDIVSSVKRVADIMAEISAASEEQSAGIQQVNQAIAQMDHVTQQNASLVEEVAAAADNLQAQTRVVADSMGAFNLGQSRAQTVALRAVARDKKPLAKPKRANPAPASLPPPRAGRKTGTDDWTEF